VISDTGHLLYLERHFAGYVQALKALGMKCYDSYLDDGHSEYFGQGGHRVVSPAVHEVFAVAETS